MFATDDLAQLHVERRSEFVGLTQGIIRAWNASTFENVVNVDGTDFEDLGVASGAEALTYQPGEVVMITKWKPSGRGGDYWIGMGGRIIFPGTGAAEKAVAHLQTSLADAIAAQVFASRIHSIDAGGSVFTDSTSYVSLTNGPVVSGVDITAAGRAIVICTSWINASSESTMSIQDGKMSFQVSGATSISPFDSAAVAVGINRDSSGTFVGGRGRQSSLMLLDGLTPGAHTFAARYAAASSGNMTQFFHRNITVIAF